MRLSKWWMLIFHMGLFLSFVYLSYSSYMNDNWIWVLWGIASLSTGYQVVMFLFTKRYDSWNAKYVVADKRILNKILLSCAISFVYIFMFLLISTVGLLSGFISANPINLMVASVISSFLVFMIIQIIQGLIT